MTESVARPQSIPAAALSEALSGHDTLLVEFYTEGCGICASMEPVLNNVARETGVETVLVNPREEPGLIDEHQITSVPTLALFRDGTEVARLAEGFVGGEDLAAFVREHR
ncbi:MAG: thioredoxin family protein [Halobaculum sp.]